MHFSRPIPQDIMLLGWPKFSEDAGFHDSWPSCNRRSFGASRFLLLVIGSCVCMSVFWRIVGDWSGGGECARGTEIWVRASEREREDGGQRMLSSLCV